LPPSPYLRSYKEDFFWFEPIDLVRKLLLSSVIVFLARGSPLQTVIGLLISVFFHILHAQLNPYKEPLHNILQHASMAVTSLTLVAGLCIQLQAVSPEGVS
jgi:hypothetical protein